MNLPGWVLRLARALAVLGCALGMLGYAGPSASAAPGFGWLRLAHLSPNTPAVDVYLYSFGNARAMIALKHVSYGTVSPYQRVPAGEYTVAMRSAGAAADSKPVLSTSVSVTAGNAYTVAGMGPLKALRLEVMQDRLRAPRGKALVRVIQASLVQHQVSVTDRHRMLTARQTFGTVSGYQVVSPGMQRLRASGGPQHAVLDLTLAADSIQTILVLDDPGHLALVALKDSAGSSRLPVGGAATGAGGTAPRPVPSPVPWLAAAAAGLLLAMAGAARLGRLRRASRHAR